jgi:hypothetical protein
MKLKKIALRFKSEMKFQNKHITIDFSEAYFYSCYPPEMNTFFLLSNMKIFQTFFFSAKAIKNTGGKKLLCLFILISVSVMKVKIPSTYGYKKWNQVFISTFAWKECERERDVKKFSVLFDVQNFCGWEHWSKNEKMKNKTMMLKLGMVRNGRNANQNLLWILFFCSACNVTWTHACLNSIKLFRKHGGSFEFYSNMDAIIDFSCRFYLEFHFIIAL